jgi:hypothetical protein
MMLVPAGFLVLMVLGGIAVDSAVAYLGQRQLTDALAAAANDAATAGLDNGAYYDGGRVVLDPAAVGAAVCQSLAAQDDGGLHHLVVAVGVAGPVVEVRGRAEVDAVFGRGLPGVGTRTVSAEVRAEAEQAPVGASGGPTVLSTVHC